MLTACIRTVREGGGLVHTIEPHTHTCSSIEIGEGMLTYGDKLNVCLFFYQLDFFRISTILFWEGFSSIIWVHISEGIH